MCRARADLAGELGEHAVLGLGERLAVAAAGDDDEAEQLAGVGDGSEAHRRRPVGADGRRHPDVEPRAAADAGPGDDGGSLAPIMIGVGLAVGDAGGQLEVAVLPRPHLGRHEHHALRRLSASCSSSSSSGIERVSRWPNVRSSSSGATRSPYTSRLARSVSQRRAGR